MWTTFGIMLGDLLDLAFYFVPNKPHITGLNWHLMLGSAGMPALIVCCQVLWAPASPQWLIGKERYNEAFNELCRLCFGRLRAAHDLYYIHVILKAEHEVKQVHNQWMRWTVYQHTRWWQKYWYRLREMFTIPRNRNAMVAAGIVMFSQQFCGVNIIGTLFSNFFRHGWWCSILWMGDSLLFLHCVRPSQFFPSISAPIILWIWFD